MTSPAKRGLIIVMILILVFPFLFFTVLKPLLSPQRAIESYGSEEGRFLYVVEEYGKFPKEKHILGKVDMSTGKTLWKEDILPAYHLNHQARRPTPPLFFDETSVYYYVQNMDDSFFLFRFDKESGQPLDSVDINAASGGLVLRDCLWVPYVQTEDKIICFNTTLRSFPQKPVESALHVTVFSKKTGDVSTFTPALPDFFILQGPRGLEDDSDFITFYNLPDILVMDKKDPSQVVMIPDIYTAPYQNGNILSYLTSDGVYMRRDLASGMTQKLFSISMRVFSPFRLMTPRGVITYHQKIDSFFLQARDGSGRLLWRYTLPPGASFYDLFAFQHSDYLPAKSAYEFTHTSYWPLLATQESKSDDASSDTYQLIMLDLQSGRPLWVRTLDEGIDCYPDHLYQEGDLYYLLYDKTLYQMDGKSGALVKSFQFTLEKNGKEYPLLPDHAKGLPLYSFQGDHLIFQSGNRFIVTADLKNEEFALYGKMKHGEKAFMTVIRGDSLHLGKLDKESK